MNIIEKGYKWDLIILSSNGCPYLKVKIRRRVPKNKIESITKIPKYLTLFIPIYNHVSRKK